MRKRDGREGHSALRRGRVSLPQHVYHVTTVTAGRSPVFESFPAARVVARCLNAPGLLRDARTLCWVLMPDHLHWLVQLGESQDLSTLVRRLKSSSALEITRQAATSRLALWSSSFYDRALRQEEDLETAARYIIGNPVRDGLVESVGDY